PVVDLRPDEFELTEDGVRQQIASVTLVRGGTAQAVRGQAVDSTSGSGSAAAAEGAAAPAPPTPLMPSVTAILFDRLSPEVRPLAGRAARAYVGTLVPPRDYAGVFLADVALKSFQPFTNQPDALRTAVDKAVSTAPSNLTA